jgi:hypothetical protein
VTSLNASILVVTEEGRHQAAPAASEGAAPVEELQFTLGEGPGVDAQAEGRAVLVDDLTLHASRWVELRAGRPGVGGARGVRADVATIGLLQERALRRATDLSEPVLSPGGAVTTVAHSTRGAVAHPASVV